MADIEFGEYKALRYLVKGGDEFLELHEKHNQYINTLVLRGYVKQEYRKLKDKPKYATGSSGSGDNGSMLI